MGPTVKVLFKPHTADPGVAHGVAQDRDAVLISLKPEEISADFLNAEERNHTTDDRDPFQRWEE